ncbi:MAG TPA: hypothetical protein VLR26_01555 [Frankiaceae bacterium]|nr:hypothetical protein [Frankiaceae bacterium]
MLAAVVVLVPGIVVYVGLRALGLAIGPAGLLGLLVMILGMVAYPVLLRRTGWVGPRPTSRPGPAATQRAEPGDRAEPGEGKRP